MKNFKLIPCCATCDHYLNNHCREDNTIPEDGGDGRFIVDNVYAKKFRKWSATHTVNKMGICDCYKQIEGENENV